MDMTTNQQAALDEALVPHASRLRIKRSNFCLQSDISSKESTLQLVYDVMRLTPFFKAFLVTADVLEIYMHELWATTTVHHHSIRFKMDNKKHIVNLEYFREMMHICLRLPDFAYLLWEDFIYQVEHKDTNKSNKMYYPRFTKVIIYYFMSKDPSIPRRNKMMMIKDDDDDQEEGNDDDQDSDEEENLGLNVGREEGQDEEDDEDELYIDVNINLEGRGVQVANVHTTQEFEDSHVTLTLFARAVSSIPGIVQRYMDQRMNEAVKTVNEQLEAKVLTRSSNSSKTSYAVAADLSEIELKKILIEKIKGNKSIHRSNEQRNLYKALVEAYESDKIILDTYENTITLKRRRDDDANKDKEPFPGSDQGSKRRREGNETESASAPKEKATRSAVKSTQGSKYQKTSASESATSKEPMQTTHEMKEPLHPEFETCADDQPIAEPSQHPKWFSQQKKPPTPDHDWNKTLPAIHGSIQPWISELVKQTDSRSSFNELMDTHVDFSAFLLNRLKVDTLTPEQSDWTANMDEEINEQELKAHYSYMAKIQEVPTGDLGADFEPLEQVQYDAGYNVFANETQHSEQPESIKCDDECVVLANLIVNLKLDVDENKKIQKQLKKANTTLAHELTECKCILAETSRTLRESNSMRDSCLVALQNKQTEFEKYKTLNDRIVDYVKLEHKLMKL
nr:hypothetical protein [Tanacetum cinerariifolium]